VEVPRRLLSGQFARLRLARSSSQQVCSRPAIIDRMLEPARRE